MMAGYVQEESIYCLRKGREVDRDCGIIYYLLHVVLWNDYSKLEGVKENCLDGS